MLAVSFSEGGLEIFDLKNPEDDLILLDESDYEKMEGGFCGKYFAFTGGKSGESIFGLVDTKEAVYVGGYDSLDDFLLDVRDNQIYLSNGNLLVHFDPDTLELLFIDYGLRFTVYGLWFMVYGLRFTVYGLRKSSNILH